MNSKIYVTRPALPPLEELIPYLQQIWHNKQLTNNGPFHQQLEKALADYLGVNYLCLFANGTLALQTALQALRITGEVITTPYSFVATSHALVWNGLTPVFADIDPQTCNMDVEKIEALITPATSAIMPVHCYGIPCNVARIQEIADRWGLQVIYDAAHAFGVKENNQSILNHGDLSVLSFHATKVFNTIEGGAIICADARMKKRIDYLKNFGFADEVTVVATGINGKMNEIQAAFGLVQLQHIDSMLTARALIHARYCQLLADIPGIEILQAPDNIEWNYAYCPILINQAYPLSRDALYDKLRQQGIMSRRYFYPLISSFSMYQHLATAQADRLPQANTIAQSVLCLPLYPELSVTEQQRIVNIIRNEIIEISYKRNNSAALIASGL